MPRFNALGNTCIITKLYTLHIARIWIYTLKLLFWFTKINEALFIPIYSLRSTLYICMLFFYSDSQSAVYTSKLNVSKKYMPYVLITLVRSKGVDNGGARGAEAPPRFFTINYVQLELCRAHTPRAHCAMYRIAFVCMAISL